MEHKHPADADRAAARGDPSSSKRKTVPTIYYIGLLWNVYCHADAHEQVRWFGDDIALKTTGSDADIESIPFKLALVRRLGSGAVGPCAGAADRRFPGARLEEAQHVPGHARAAWRRSSPRGSGCRRCARRSGSATSAGTGRAPRTGSARREVPLSGADHQPRGRRRGAPQRRRQGRSAARVAIDRRGRSARSQPRRRSSSDHTDDVLVRARVGVELGQRHRAPSRAWRATLADPRARRRAGGDGRSRRHEVAVHRRSLARRREPRGRGRAEARRMPHDDVVAVRRAGYVHDLGRLGTLEHDPGRSPARSRPAELERVRLQPYITDRILAGLPDAPPCPRARCAQLRAARRLRLPGRARRRPSSRPSTRLLAAADAYHAMTEPRAYRDARRPSQPAAHAAGRGSRQESSTGTPSRRCSRRPATARARGASGQQASPPARSRCSACSHADARTRKSPRRLVVTAENSVGPTSSTSTRSSTSPRARAPRSSHPSTASSAASKRPDPKIG